MSLAEAVRRVAPFVSHDKKKPTLHHVLVEPMRVVATDSHRLVVVEGTFDVAVRTLVDPETLAEAPGVEDYPDVDRFLGAPAASDLATVDARWLLDAVEASAGEDDEPLPVELADGAIRVGDDAATPTLHVNATYLHDAIETVGMGPIVVEVVDDRSPMAVRGGDVIVLVMPVRVRS